MKILFLSLFLLIPCLASADKDLTGSKLKISAGDRELKFSGYFDTYIAYDFNHPITGGDDIEEFDDKVGRDYTSNPLYDREFSIGYAFFQIEYQQDSIGFRLAYHLGDIVQKMYYDEPERIKDIREASLTWQMNKKLILEIGYMPSIFGFETFINRDNMHASRSFMTDFAPDFDAGARLYWKLNKESTLKFQVTNGWQVERDRNDKLALGAAYVYDKPGERHFNWGVFYGDEGAINGPSSRRFFNNLFFKMYSNRWIFAPVLDLGWEERTSGLNKSWVNWQSYGGSARYALNKKNGLAFRYDRTRDHENVIPELQSRGAPMPRGWDSNGYTLTYEHLINASSTFRIEGRYVKSRDPIFKTEIANEYSKENGFIMVSFASSF